VSILNSLHSRFVAAVVLVALWFWRKVGVYIDANVNTVFVLVRHLLLIVVHIILWLTSTHGTLLIGLALCIARRCLSHHFIIAIPLAAFLLLRGNSTAAPVLCLRLLSTHVLVCLFVDHAL
jgi:hypothetical protein